MNDLKICDYCGEVYEIQYMQIIRNGRRKRYICSDCIKQLNQIKKGGSCHEHKERKEK